MKWWVIVLPLVLASGPSKAEPGPTITYLMNDPVSMLDLGILRMSQKLDRNLDAPPGLSPVNLYQYVTYNWEKNRISISASFRIKEDTGELREDICLITLRYIANALGITMDKEFVLASAMTMEATFGHEGFQRSDLPVGIGNKLLAIVHLESRVYKFGEIVFAKTEGPDCQIDWTDGLDLKIE